MLRWHIRTLLLFSLAFASGDPAFARKPTVVDRDPSTNPDAVVGPNYLTQSMLSSITPRGLDIWVPGRMPKSDNEPASTYSYYPATIVFNNDAVGSLASPATNVKFAFRQWGYRCDLCVENSYNHKPNEIFAGISTSRGMPARASFTSYERAMAAQIAVTLYVAGYPSRSTGPCASGVNWCGYLDATKAAGIPDQDVIDWRTAVASADRIFTKVNGDFITSVDKVFLPPARLSDGVQKPWGVICICEYADLRLASQTLWVSQQIARILHGAGYKYAVSPDSPVKRSGMGAGFCGVGIKAPNCDMANLAAIANAVDMMSMGVGPPPRGMTFTQYMMQSYALWGAPGSYPSSVMSLRFALGAWPDGTTIDDAHAARGFLLSSGWRSLSLFWAYTGRGGGECRPTVQKILILLGLPARNC